MSVYLHLAISMPLELPQWLRGKEFICQCKRQKRCEFDPWVDNTQLQYSCLEKSMDRGAWQATVHGFAKSPT